MLVGEHGGLVGPFNAFVTAPDTGKYLSSLGAKARFGTSLERRLSEIAIITTGARWQAEFEWWAHARIGRRDGVASSPSTRSAADRTRGSRPRTSARSMRPRMSSATPALLSKAVYDAAQQFLGDAGWWNWSRRAGYYTLISFLLNAFDVPLPPGAKPAWDSTARGNGSWRPATCRRRQPARRRPRAARRACVSWSSVLAPGPLQTWTRRSATAGLSRSWRPGKARRWRAPTRTWPPPR